MKVTFNEAVVRRIKAPANGNRVHFYRGAIIDGRPVVSGLGVRVTSAGAKAFVFQYRDATGKQVRQTLGRVGSMTCVDAARAARKLWKALERGEAIEAPKRGKAVPSRPAGSAASGTGQDGQQGPIVNIVLDDFLARHVRPNLRDAAEVERLLNKDVRPAIGTKGVYEVRRRDIVAMLDAIEDRGAKVAVDRVLAVIRKAFNWYALRDGEFVSPIIRGMARAKPADRTRDRVLSDDEIRTLWKALAQPADGEWPACFPAFVKALLLTAQRRGEVAEMRWPELSKDTSGAWLWTIPAEKYKTKRANVVPLTPEARAAIEADGTSKRGYVFSSTNGELAFSGFSKAKAALDDRMARIRSKARQPAMAHWTFHDLRRTARTLMSHAGVDTDIAERVLGHAIPGVRGIYDRHAYIDEKREALAALARSVDIITTDW